MACATATATATAALLVPFLLLLQVPNIVYYLH